MAAMKPPALLRRGHARSCLLTAGCVLPLSTKLLPVLAAVALPIGHAASSTAVSIHATMEDLWEAVDGGEPPGGGGATSAQAQRPHSRLMRRAPSSRRKAQGLSPAQAAAPRMSLKRRPLPSGLAERQTKDPAVIANNSGGLLAGNASDDRPSVPCDVVEAVTNFVTFNGSDYARIDNYIIDGHDKSCHHNKTGVETPMYLQVPAGWEAASRSDDAQYIVRNHHWGADIVTVLDWSYAHNGAHWEGDSRRTEADGKGGFAPIQMINGQRMQNCSNNGTTAVLIVRDTAKAEQDLRGCQAEREKQRKVGEDATKRSNASLETLPKKSGEDLQAVEWQASREQASQAIPPAPPQAPASQRKASEQDGELQASKEKRIKDEEAAEESRLQKLRQEAKALGKAMKRRKKILKKLKKATARARQAKMDTDDGLESTTDDGLSDDPDVVSAQDSEKGRRTHHRRDAQDRTSHHRKRRSRHRRQKDAAEPTAATTAPPGETAAAGPSEQKRQESAEAGGSKSAASPASSATASSANSVDRQTASAGASAAAPARTAPKAEGSSAPGDAAPAPAAASSEKASSAPDSQGSSGARDTAAAAAAASKEKAGAKTAESQVGATASGDAAASANEKASSAADSQGKAASAGDAAAATNQKASEGTSAAAGDASASNQKANAAPSSQGASAATGDAAASNQKASSGSNGQASEATSSGTQSSSAAAPPEDEARSNDDEVAGTEDDSDETLSDDATGAESEDPDTDVAADADTDDGDPDDGGGSSVEQFHSEEDVEIAHDELFVNGCVDRLKMATVDTRQESSEILVRGSPGWSSVNLGKDKPWYGPSTKLALFQAWLRTQAKDTIAILADDDLLSGGCSAEQVCSNYHRLVKASGGKEVVMSAEMGLYPYTDESTKEKYGDLWDQMYTTLSNLNMSLDAYQKAARCSHFKGPGACSSPPAYQYVNSGFLMGPVEKLLTVVKGARKMSRDSGHHDQGQLTAYFLDKPEDIALDYAGLLSLSTYQLDSWQLLQVGRKGSRVGSLLSEGSLGSGKQRAKARAKSRQALIASLIGDLEADNRKVARNSITGRVQCFLHFNSGGKLSPSEWSGDAAAKPAEKSRNKAAHDSKAAAKAQSKATAHAAAPAAATTPRANVKQTPGSPKKAAPHAAAAPKTVAVQKRVDVKLPPKPLAKPPPSAKLPEKKKLPGPPPLSARKHP
eukprot:TRINITY_DN13742_c0_g1_i2.p1 TRINITY_DN13742_c0_g1~~TRINITY_DN13742_c0_g1_i2.p1  ORF type:complete len:1203 (-),score=352.51 TRINITY_DN13742_c0_g1_i2:62-3670(-)